MIQATGNLRLHTIRLKEFVLIWYGKFHYFTINALNLYDNFGEKRIKFRLLVFVLLAFEDPGSMSANF